MNETTQKTGVGTKLLKVTRDVLGVALAIAGLPGGAALIAKVPGVGGLILKWGLRPLAAVLDILPEGVEVSDEMVAEALAKKGGRLEAIDLTTLYGGPTSDPS